jgi:hypothetical protein
MKQLRIIVSIPPGCPDRTALLSALGELSKEAPHLVVRDDREIIFVDVGKHKVKIIVSWVKPADRVR